MPFYQIDCTDLDFPGETFEVVIRNHEVSIFGDSNGSGKYIIYSRFVNELMGGIIGIASVDAHNTNGAGEDIGIYNRTFTKRLNSLKKSMKRLHFKKKLDNAYIRQLTVLDRDCIWSNTSSTQLKQIVSIESVVEFLPPEKREDVWRLANL